MKIVVTIPRPLSSLFDIAQAPLRVRATIPEGVYELCCVSENPYGNRPLWVVYIPDGRAVGATRVIWQQLKKVGEITYTKQKEY